MVGDVGTIEIDPFIGAVTYMGRSLRLAPREIALRSALAESCDRVVSREELQKGVWQQEAGTLRVVDVYVYRLRSKLRKLDHPGISTVFRRGYRLLGSEPAKS